MEIVLDGRRKLLPCQVERIKAIRKETGLSYRKIAELYYDNRIGHQVIYLACNPNKKVGQNEHNKKLKKGGRYYKTDDNTESVKKTRKKQKGINEFFNIKTNQNVKKESKAE